jgi:hypothetical protein
MAINYTSYPAWNDPYNPWLRFTSVTLSGSYVDDNSDPFNVNTTLTLSTFNPPDAGSNQVVYVNQDFTFNMIFTNNSEWVINRGDGLVQFLKGTSARAVPCNGNLSAFGFEDYAGTGVNTLSLTINRGYTQWEKRRRRLLGYR